MLQHDDRCESFMVTPGGFTDCGCFDRAIAAARHEGKIVGVRRGWSAAMDWAVLYPDQVADLSHEEAARIVAEMEAKP